VKLVRALKQRDVDRAALEAALAEVVRRHGGRDLPDRVERDRTSVGRARILVQAEGVADLHAVYREAVVARVDARELHRPTAITRVRQIDRRERIATLDVADVAVDRGDLADVGLGKNSLRTCRPGAGTGNARSGHDDVATAGIRRRAQVDRKTVGLLDDGEDVGDGGVALRARHFDRERATGTQAGQAEAAVGAAGGGGARSGRHLGRNHRCPADRHAAQGDGAANGRCGFLCRRGHRSHERDRRRTQEKVVTHQHYPLKIEPWPSRLDAALITPLPSEYFDSVTLPDANVRPIIWECRVAKRSRSQELCGCTSSGSRR